MTANPDDASIHWGWVSVCAVAGVTLIVLAFVVESRWGWVGTAPSVLVELGAAVLLAGVLFVLEQRFTRRARQVTDARIGALEQRVTERTQSLERRLDEIQGATEERVQDRDVASDAVMDALGNKVSFHAVTNAIAEANKLRASARGRWTVEASPDPAGIRLTFSWGYHTRDDSVSKPPNVPLLEVGAELDKRAGEWGTPVVEVVWDAAEPPDAVGARLIDELRRVGRWEGETTLDWGLALSNLQRTLRVAVGSRRRDPGAWHLGGALYELVGSDWAITEAGVESPPHAFLLPQNDFPEQMGRPQLDPFRPARPKFANATEWGIVIKRASDLFPRSMRSALFDPGWRPIDGPLNDSTS